MQLEYKIDENNTLNLIFSADLGDFAMNNDGDALLQKFSSLRIKNIQINMASVQKWDTGVVVFLFNLFKWAKSADIEISGKLPDGIERLLKLAFADNRNPTIKNENTKSFVENIGASTINTYDSFKSGWGFLKTVFASLKRLFLGRAIMRKRDFFFSLEDASFKAFGIVSLICFMVGLIVGFVGAMQLQMFGAQIYVASLVMLAMTRVMGAMMTGIIMSGRTGSAYAATIGTMQVNEEIDALKTMGINVIDFLLLPRMLALIIMMPLLTVFADVLGILGGASVGIVMLGLSPDEYWKYSLDALSLSNFLIGILHGAVFGIVIALCGCYYGIKSGKDANSVGMAATHSVVASIVWIIVATAVLTVIFQIAGL